jgi:hypothetical protein
MGGMKKEKIEIPSDIIDILNTESFNRRVFWTDVADEIIKYGYENKCQITSIIKALSKVMNRKVNHETIKRRAAELGIIK